MPSGFRHHSVCVHVFTRQYSLILSTIPCIDTEVDRAFESAYWHLGIACIDQRFFSQRKEEPSQINKRSLCDVQPLLLKHRQERIWTFFYPKEQFPEKPVVHKSLRWVDGWKSVCEFFHPWFHGLLKSVEEAALWVEAPYPRLQPLEPWRWWGELGEPERTVQVEQNCWLRELNSIAHFTTAWWANCLCCISPAKCICMHDG